MPIKKKQILHYWCIFLQEPKKDRMRAFSGEDRIIREQRVIAKQNKDWATRDKIRNELTALGFEVKDTKDGFSWKLNK